MRLHSRTRECSSIVRRAKLGPPQWQLITNSLHRHAARRERTARDVVGQS